MDDLQLILSHLTSTVPNCLDDRQKLRATLNDLLPGKKLESNLILFAYDENIVNLLQSTSDTTLQALRIIRNLVDGYGISRDAATWAVVCWCRILGKREIAQVLEEIPTSMGLSNHTDQVHTITNTLEIGLGIYKAGYDFKAGDIVLRHLTKDVKDPLDKDESILGHYSIECYINNVAQSKGAKKVGEFVDKCHLEIEDGKYLIIKCNSYYHSLIKIELAEYD